MNKNGFIVIDVIVVGILFALAIWFLVKGYPETVGAFINNFF